MARLWHTAGAHFRVGRVDMAMLGQPCHTTRAHVRVDRVGILGGWWCMARLGRTCLTAGSHHHTAGAHF